MHPNINKFNGKIRVHISQLSCLLSILVILGGCSQNTELTSVSHTPTSKPNIVIFYVDDLGYQDVSAYGATQISTPNIDALAQNGIRFTDAHSSSATCTPSRYSLLTGEYAFRNNASVLKGDAALIIDTQKPTMASMLKKVGYQTAVVGKWHLGLGDGKSPVDWNTEVKPGPNEIGFDYSFLLPSTGDRVPSVYLEDGKVLNLDSSDPLYVSYAEKIGERPTGTANPELLRQPADRQHSDTIINGISRIGYMQGGKSAEFVDEDFYQIFTNKANDFITSNHEKPFFLFFSFHDIHVPRLPADRFKGKSNLGLRGDAILQMDYITGQVVEQLKELNLLDNTLIVFTSDNGPVLNDGYDDGAVETNGEHKPSGDFRGGKYSAHEAGTRVPTILHFPAKVKSGVSDSLMSQVDLYASIAQLLSIDLSQQEAIDSENHLDAWLDASQSGRDYLIQESYTLSLRKGNWKYIEPTQKQAIWVQTDKNIESGLQPEPQLYDLSEDVSEQNNLAAAQAEVANSMQAKIDSIRLKQSR